MAIREVALATTSKNYRLPFNASTASLRNLYTSCLPAFATQGIVKLFVDIFDQPGITTAASSALEKELRLLNVLTVQRPLDLLFYFALPDEAKRRLQLEIIHTACVALCLGQGWSQEPFEEAYQHCLRANLTNAWVMKIDRKRFFSSPDGLFTACVVCQWTLTEFVVDVVIMSKQGNDYQCQRIVENEAYREQALDQASWINEHTFQVTASRPTQQWEVHI